MLTISITYVFIQINRNIRNVDVSLQHRVLGGLFGPLHPQISTTRRLSYQVSLHHISHPVLQSDRSTTIVLLVIGRAYFKIIRKIVCSFFSTSQHNSWKPGFAFGPILHALKPAW